MIEEKSDPDKIGGARGQWGTEPRNPSNRAAIFDYCIKTTEQETQKLEEKY